MITLQSSLGIQFGRNYLRLVHLKKSLKEVALDAHSLVHFPPALSAEELDKYLSQEISGFLQEKNIGKDNVWISLPRKECLIRFITLPLSVEENLREVIRYEVEKYIPFSEDDIYFEFLSLAREVATKKLKVIVLAIKKPVLHRYLALLENAGIAPLGIEVSATALSNFFLTGVNGSEQKPAAVVNIERDGFEVHWICQGTLHYSRAIDFDAEGDGDRIAQIIHELRNGFRAGFPLQIFGHGEGAPIVLLTGDETKEDFIAGFPVIPEVPLEAFPGEVIFPRLHFSDSFPLSLSAGIGPALKGIRRVPLDINFLPQHLQKKIKNTGLHLTVPLFIAVVALTLLWGIGSIVKERMELRRVEREIAALKGEVLAVQNIQKEAQEITHRIENFYSIQQAEFSKLEILRELSSILPQSVWITELRYNKNELNLAGFATSASGIIALLDGSPLFQSSEFTAPITRDMEGQENFRIKTTTKRK